MSFFAATNAQLTAAAPGWVFAEYGALRKVMARNPFTGKELGEITQWECLSRAPEGGLEDDDLHALIKEGRAYKWKLATTDLPRLLKILVADASEQEAASFARLALLGPPDVDHWVYDFSPALATALRALSDEEAASVAARWGERIEWTHPPTGLLDELREVAREAGAAQARMLTYISV